MQHKSAGPGKTLRAECKRLWERQQDVFMCGERLGKTWEESEPYVRTAQVWVKETLEEKSWGFLLPEGVVHVPLPGRVTLHNDSPGCSMR